MKLKVTYKYPGIPLVYTCLPPSWFILCLHAKRLSVSHGVCRGVITEWWSVCSNCFIINISCSSSQVCSDHLSVCVSVCVCVCVIDGSFSVQCFPWGLAVIPWNITCLLRLSSCCVCNNKSVNIGGVFSLGLWRGRVSVSRVSGSSSGHKHSSHFVCLY